MCMHDVIYEYRLSEWVQYMYSTVIAPFHVIRPTSTLDNVSIATLYTVTCHANIRSVSRSANYATTTRHTLAHEWRSCIALLEYNRSLLNRLKCGCICTCTIISLPYRPVLDRPALTPEMMTIIFIQHVRSSLLAWPFNIALALSNLSLCAARLATAPRHGQSKSSWRHRDEK